MLVSDEDKAIEVVKALSDDYSRKILLSIILNSLPIEEISKEQNIPISTCYRRIHEMLHFGVIRPDRTIIREDGKKYVCYKSAIKNATIQMHSGELKVDVVVNRDPSEKLGTMWSNVRISSPDNLTKISESKVPTSVPPQKVAPLIIT
jgi:DNA-binding Lrp family transcriptional regulator